MKNPDNKNDIRWAFFGSSNFSVIVLDELKALGLLPQLIVTTPDKPRGRGLKISAGPVRECAEKHSIEVIAPATLKTGEASAELKNRAEKFAAADGANSWDVFLIASYGKIVPAEILDIPTRKTLNIHPSLLPKFRGPTPLESAILEANETGVTIMQVDEQVDHGPIVASRSITLSDSVSADGTPLEWPPYYKDLETLLAREGAKLFAEILPGWVANDCSVKATEQNHAAATFTKKIAKEDLLIDLVDDPEETLRKIRAYSCNRGAYFILKQKSKDGTIDKETRVIVTRAKIDPAAPEKLIIERVKPEGRGEMAFEDFKRGIRE
jgi:methionyl-tRNA formyltransferase